MFSQDGYSGYVIPLLGLVQQGYLTGNAKNGTNGTYYIVNPMTNEDIGNCYIGVGYDSNNKLVILGSNGSANACPKNEDYSG